MDLKYFCEKINLGADAFNAISSIDITGEEFDSLRERFFSDKQSFYSIINTKAKPQEWFLAMYVRIAIAQKKKYDANNIKEEVYWDTFSDISIWEKDCHAKTGGHGLINYEWFSLHLNLELFKLGRLQFQPVPFLPDIQEKDLPHKGQRVINVHIPKGEGMTPEKVEESYRQAVEFFNIDPVYFVCSSWLLSPALKILLPSGSNIVAFRNDYRILTVDAGSRQAEERIFEFVTDMAEDYPENTSLQRKAKQYLLEGNKIPSAFGIKKAFE